VIHSLQGTQWSPEGWRTGLYGERLFCVQPLSKNYEIKVPGVRDVQELKEA
jgi:hypothetical protein